MQLFLIGFIIVEICEIFSVGYFPLNGGVRRVSLDAQLYNTQSNKCFRHSPLSILQQSSQLPGSLC